MFDILPLAGLYLRVCGCAINRSDHGFSCWLDANFKPHLKWIDQSGFKSCAAYNLYTPESQLTPDENASALQISAIHPDRCLITLM
jgi:hypothetical protein